MPIATLRPVFVLLFTLTTNRGQLYKDLIGPQWVEEKDVFSLQDIKLIR